jgi:hypothetical protein
MPQSGLSNLPGTATGRAAGMATHEACFNATAFPAQMRIALPREFPRFGAVAHCFAHLSTHTYARSTFKWKGVSRLLAKREVRVGQKQRHERRSRANGDLNAPDHKWRRG